MKPILTTYKELELMCKNSTTGTIPSQGIVYGAQNCFKDVISCLVTEERNGEFSLSMTIGNDDPLVDGIYPYNIIIAKPNDTDKAQPFVIYKIRKDLNGRIEIKAEHISRMMKYLTVEPLQFSGNVSDALTSFEANIVGGDWSTPIHHYNFSTDMSQTAIALDIKEPRTVFSMLFGQEGSFIDHVGGEWKFDYFQCTLMNERGTDRKVTLLYGKNITGATWETDVTGICTGIYPYWNGVDENGEDVVVLPYPDLPIHTTASEWNKFIPYDFSQYIENKPTQQELKNYATTYYNSHISEFETPMVTIKVSMIPLWQSQEYQNIPDMEKVSLCDTVHIYFDKIGIKADAKVVKTVYNVLKERYDSIEIGTIKQKLTGSLQKRQAQLESATKKLSKKVSEWVTWSVPSNEIAKYPNVSSATVTVKYNRALGEAVFTGQIVTSAALSANTKVSLIRIKQWTNGNINPVPPSSRMPIELYNDNNSKQHGGYVDNAGIISFSDSVGTTGAVNLYFSFRCRYKVIQA